METMTKNTQADILVQTVRQGKFLKNGVWRPNNDRPVQSIIVKVCYLWFCFVVYVQLCSAVLRI